MVLDVGIVYSNINGLLYGDGDPSIIVQPPPVESVGVIKYRNASDPVLYGDPEYTVLLIVFPVASSVLDFALPVVAT